MRHLSFMDDFAGLVAVGAALLGLLMLGDIAACVGLDLIAADAAGVRVSLGRGDVADTLGCGVGDTSICLSVASAACRPEPESHAAA